MGQGKEDMIKQGRGQSEGQRSKIFFFSKFTFRLVFCIKAFLFCVSVGNCELQSVRFLGVITGDLSCYCNSQLMFRHHQEKHCGFRIHPGRLIIITRAHSLYQTNQLCHTKFIFFVDGVISLVGINRIETCEPSTVKWICNQLNSYMQGPMIN